MRGLTGDKHPSVNLPPLPLPTRAEGGGRSRVASGEDGFLVVGRDFNRARFDPVANSKFMDDRPWAAVDAFARNLVIGEACLSSLVAPVDRVDADAGGEPEDDGATRERLDPAAPCDGEGIDPSGARLRDARADRARRAPRHAYRFSVRYYGPGFAGWAWRAEDANFFAAKRKGEGDETARGEDGGVHAAWSVGAFSAAAATQSAIAPLFADENTRPLWCAGRTDRGVHGLAQTVSFTTARDLEAELGGSVSLRETVERLVSSSPAGRLGHLRVVAEPPPRKAHAKFHATFCATWRRYVYVFPKRQSMREERTPRRDVDVSLLNEMLGALVGASREDAKPGVDCYAFARDTVEGKDSRVVFRVARAFRGRVPAATARDENGNVHRTDAEDVVVIELVADRFLRKLVRVLVATAAREAATGAAPDVLLALAAARERAATASAAPPSGLFFAGVGYGDHPEYDEA